MLLPAWAQAAKRVHPQMRFGFSLYGMKGVEIGMALRTCKEIGYDCVELSVMPGYLDPQSVPAAERKRIKELLKEHGLAVPVIMENLPLLGDEQKHRATLERLRQAAAFGHDVSPDTQPLIETVLGSKPDEWKSVREKFVERLQSWADVAKEAKTFITFKAHVGNALHTPEDALWLVKQINSPWIKLAYDYSHFQLRGFKLADSLATLIGETRFIHIKDSTGELGKFKFVLPGEGSIDYVEYFQLLKMHGYRDSIIVEVSGQVFNVPGYDAVAAAKGSFEKVAPAFAKAV